MNRKIVIIILLLIFLIIIGCVAPSDNEGSIQAESQSPQLSESPAPETIPPTSPQTTSLKRPAFTPSPRLPSVTPTPSRTGVSCGSSACPPGWNCCGQICYDPMDDPTLSCEGGTLRQKISKHTCADIECNGLPCCNDYLRGPMCYDPEHFRCGAA